MAELLRCKMCGYETVRCGMSNHIAHAHPFSYEDNNKSIEGLVESLGEISCAELKRRKKNAQVA